MPKDPKDYHVRPNDEQKTVIIEKAATGQSLVSICRELGINRAGLFYATQEDPLFQKKLENARMSHAEDLEDSLLNLADNLNTLVDVGAARIKSENIKSVLAFRNPRRYGNKIDLNVNAKIDLSSVLAAADARIIPILELKQATKELQAASEDVEVNEATAVEDTEPTESTESVEPVKPTPEIVAASKKGSGFDDLL